MSASVVRGFTIANLVTVSPSCTVGMHEREVGPHQPVRPSLVLLRRPAEPPEHHHRELGLEHQLEVAAAADLRGGRAGDVERALDRLGVGVGAVHGEREPERQAPGAAGQVHA